MAKKREFIRVKGRKRSGKPEKKSVDIGKGGINIDHSPCKVCYGKQFYLNYVNGKTTCLGCGNFDEVYIK